MELLEKQLIYMGENSLNRKAVRKWLGVIAKIDRKLTRRYRADIALLYLDTDLQGRTVTDILCTLRSNELLQLDGLKRYLCCSLAGPYVYDYVGIRQFSIYYQLVYGRKEPKRTRKVFFLSLRAWVMSPSLRFYTSLAVSLTINAVYQYYLMHELDVVRENIILFLNNEPEKPFPANSSLVCFLVFPVSGLIYSVAIRVSAGKAMITSWVLLSQIIATIGFVMMLKYIYGEETTNGERVMKLTNWASVLEIGWWGWIISELEYSAHFGVVVVTLKAMLLQTVGFSVLLGFIIYCYSSIYLMRNYKNTPQAVGTLGQSRLPSPSLSSPL